MIRVICQENWFCKYIIVSNIILFLPKIDFSHILKELPHFSLGDYPFPSDKSVFTELKRKRDSSNKVVLMLLILLR